MEYRRLGRSGLKVSVLAYGTWVTFEQMSGHAVRDSLVAAREAGVTLFDTAETYAHGGAESLLGAAIEDLGWDRRTYVLATKLYWGLHDWPHLRTTLNRKYLLQGIDGCLERLRTSFVDLLLCHRRDPDTPIEETVWTMSDIVASGKALYWGTSEWPPEDIRAAWVFADRHGLRKPVVEQPEYNLFARRRVEHEYRELTAEFGIGLMTWSPLASGLLTGKYHDGVPTGSRGALAGYRWLRRTLLDDERNRRVAELASIAREIGCTAAQLAIAWCTVYPAVSSVIIGASGPAQLRHNVAAVDVASRLTPELLARIDHLFG
ncbi:MAG TPA: aldo/keto reductase [Pseudonocardiaceae bacterium]